MRIGSLFSGYGGLELGVQNVLGGDVVWHSEIDEAPSRILAHHYPDVPNHGDITKVDWSTVEPVDILTGGFPCQDVSLAGRRAGITDGTRSGLWSEFARAIDVLRPELVVIENVRGLLSAKGDGAMEPDPWGVGDGATRPVVNALGVVLGDLASLGYDTVRGGVRASDAGAPHGRYRVFIVAHPSGNGRGWHAQLNGEQVGPELEASLGEHADGRVRAAVEDTNIAARGERGVAAPGQAEGGWSRADTGGRSGAPAANSGGAGGREGHSPSGFGSEVEDWAGVVDEHRPRSGGTEWGVYGPAIERWERTTGRVAPTPTNPDGKGGAHRLSARFVEWMMGNPDGWVTDPSIGISRNQQLKALGNGVVPQQAELAVRTLLEVA